MIPRYFTLAGNQWTVEFQDDPKDDEGESVCGYCAYGKYLIVIRKDMPDALRFQTWLHEKQHAILYTMGYHDHSERKIEGYAQLDYQLITSSMGEPQCVSGAHEAPESETH